MFQAKSPYDTVKMSKFTSSDTEVSKRDSMFLAPSIAASNIGRGNVEMMSAGAQAKHDEPVSEAHPSRDFEGENIPVE